MAYQVSSGGTEESVLHVLDVATGELVDGPIDRARYSPVAWLPGGEAFYYVRRLPPEELPQDEAQYHRRVWLHRLGTPGRPTTSRCSATGLDHTNYYGVSVSRDGRWLIVSASAGTAPRTDVWIADLTASGLEAPAFVEVAVGLDAETGAWVARDGRLYVHTNLDAPRGPDRGHGPDRAGRRALDDPAGARTRRPSWRTSRSSTAAATDTTPTLLLASWRRHSVSEVSVHDPRTGERRPDAFALPGLGSISGLATHPDGGPEVWFSYADHTTPTQRAPVRRAHRRDDPVGGASRARRRPARRPRPADRGHQPRRHDGPRVRRRAHRRARRRRPAARDRADDPLRLRRLPDLARPRVLRDDARVGRGGRRVRRRQPARRRRGGRGVAPRGHARAQAERVRRLPRRRRPPRRAGLDHARTSWRAGAAPTAACWSARP